MISSLHTKYPFTSLISLGCAWLLLAAMVQAEVSCRISSRFLARGEQALLEVAVVGHKPTRFPEIDPIKGVEIRPAGRGPQTQLLPGRRIEHVFEYIVTSYEVGDHSIPPVSVEAGGIELSTEALDFSVFNPDELQWSETTVGKTKFRYASTFKVINSAPYEGENIPVEIKVFVPRDIFVVDWGIPDFERDGVTAWRFQPSSMRSQINLLGMPYISVAYPSTLTPTRTGKIGIGPAKIRLVTTQVVMDGILKRVHVNTYLQVPKLEFESSPLPANPPTGFENAIGNFKISVTTPSTDVQEGDPIPLEIIVSGTGNHDTLRPPSPANSLGWKIYEASREQRASERRLISGTTVFHQFMRPLELKGSIPAFKLVFFNPKTKRYESATSEPISLQMTPAANTTVAPNGPPPAASTPVEQMTDILGLIPQAPLVQPKSPKQSGWWLHAIGALLAILLVGKALWMRNKHRLHRDPREKDRLAELRELEQSKKNDHEFLMAAGRFVERWHGQSPSADAQSILSERDALCFRKEKDAASLAPQRRRAILKTLRKTLTLALTLLATSLITIGQSDARPPAESAEEAYHEARYDKAIQTWLAAAPYEQLSADTLYHIGNACYRAGSPGNALLYYRRALARDPNHHESRQNLRFIERKHGALSVQRPAYQYTLAKLPLATWKNATWAGIWICALAALVFPATQSGARLRVAAVIAMVSGPMLVTCGALAWRHFPDDAAFAPIIHQAVIIEEGVTVHTDASRTSPEVIQAPPGSLCEVIHDTGKWTYISFASRTRGWVPTASIRKVIPDSPPEAPEIRKPRANGKSA